MKRILVLIFTVVSINMLNFDHKGAKCLLEVMYEKILNNEDNNRDRELRNLRKILDKGD